jgi:hypothetical protein
MKNPFFDFGPEQYTRRTGAIERTAKHRKKALGLLHHQYRRLIEEEAQHLVWPVEHERILRVYTASMQRLEDFVPNGGDIEEFCASLDGKDSPLWVPGPAGVFLSALINASSDARVELRLRDYGRRFHFLGYLLPESKTLELNGDVGDFCGAALDGGRLLVHGAAGDWCGAGMLRGNLFVQERTGKHTGIWMQGGRIQVEGAIEGLGEPRYGGEVLRPKTDASEEGALIGSVG